MGVRLSVNESHSRSWKSIRNYRRVRTHQACSSENCQSRLSETARIWLEGEPCRVVIAVQSLRSTLDSQPPFPFSMRAPHASRRANDVPTDRCDLRPSGVSLCLIRPSTSCSPANWPSSLRAGARAPPGSVCSVLFLGQWWMPAVPGHHPKLHQRGGLNRFHFFLQERGWMSVITFNLKF